MSCQTLGTSQDAKNINGNTGRHEMKAARPCGAGNHDGKEATSWEDMTYPLNY